MNKHFSHFSNMLMPFTCPDGTSGNVRGEFITPLLEYSQNHNPEPLAAWIQLQETLLPTEAKMIAEIVRGGLKRDRRELRTENRDLYLEFISARAIAALNNSPINQTIFLKTKFAQEFEGKDSDAQTKLLENYKDKLKQGKKQCEAEGIDIEGWG